MRYPLSPREEFCSPTKNAVIGPIGRTIGRQPDWGYQSHQTKLILGKFGAQTAGLLPSRPSRVRVPSPAPLSQFDTTTV